MLHSLALSLLVLTLLAGSAAAQTKPRAKAKTTRKTATRRVPRRAARTTDSSQPGSSAGTSNTGSSRGNGDTGNVYAAPGMPVNSSANSGKNTPPYSGPAAPKGTTLTTPK